MTDLIKAESKKVSPVSRTLVVDVKPYVNPASLPAVVNKIKSEVLPRGVMDPKFDSLTEINGKFTAKVKPTNTNVKSTEFGKVDEVERMIIGMVEKEIAVRNASERTLTFSISWTKLGLTTEPQKKRLLSALKKHVFLVGGKTEKLLKNAQNQSGELKVSFDLPENSAPSTRRTASNPTRTNTPPANSNVPPVSTPPQAPPATPVGGRVTATRALTPAEMNPYVKGVGKALAFGGLVLAASMFGPATFLLAAGVMMANKYLDNQRAMAAPVSGS